MQSGLMDFVEPDQSTSAQAIIADLSAKAVMLASKHVLLSGRTIITSEDLLRAFKTVVNPSYIDYAPVETPTHVEGLAEFKQSMDEEYRRWEAQRAAGSKSPPPPPPPTDQEVIRTEIAPAAAADIMEALCENAEVVDDDEVEEFCCCSDEVQQAHGDMYIMWQAHKCFEEFVNDIDIRKTPIMLAIIRAIRKMEQRLQDANEAEAGTDVNDAQEAGAAESRNKGDATTVSDGNAGDGGCEA